MAEGKCAIWGTSATVTNDGGPPEYDSPRAGGKYRLGNAYHQSFNPADSEFKLKLTSWLIEQRLLGVKSPEFSTFYDFVEKIKNRKFLSTTERIDRYFRYCMQQNLRPGTGVYSYKKSKDGQVNVGLQSDEIYAWTETLDYNEFRFFRHLVQDLGLINAYVDIGGQPDFDILTASGYKRLEDMERVNENSKQAFVAMWFDASLDDTYELGIRPAIVESGFDPLRISEKSHNNKIDDEIIAEIKRSKFVVADFTSGIVRSDSGRSIVIPRGGVYYEAGFAKGLGLEVIWTCRKDCFSDIHFDTRQFNHIVWENIQDLKKQLYDRIRAVFNDPS